MKKPVVILSLVLVFCYAFSWHDEKSIEEQDEAVGLPGYTFSEPGPNNDDVMRILVHYDMEGLSGQDDWRTAFFQYTEQYKKGRELLTSDVNAVIEGLFDGGADEVYVWDNHGSGSPGPDIIIEKMDARAKFVYPRRSPQEKAPQEKVIYDAIAAVGMHSKTGGGGFMAHTMSLGMDYILNERSLNETELLMLRVGRRGTPVIFASGDDKLKEQLQPYHWIEYVTVKHAISTYAVDLRPIEEVHKEMRKAATKAVRNITRAKAVELRLPIRGGFRAESPASLSVLNGVPGIDFNKDTVTFDAKSYGEAIRYMNRLARVARTGYQQVLMQTVSDQENSNTIFNEYWNNLFIDWLDIKPSQQKRPEK
jgi:D-amino peptidase